MWKFAAGSGESILRDEEIYSNDIYAILMTYGVEMARAAILREMGGVFGAYNIQVDRRHLELIADYMVRHRGMLRIGSELIGIRLSRVATSRLIGRAFLRIHHPCSRRHTKRQLHSFPMQRSTETLTTSRRLLGTLLSDGRTQRERERLT
jgi:hypothetical protein